MRRNLLHCIPSTLGCLLLKRPGLLLSMLLYGGVFLSAQVNTPEVSFAQIQSRIANTPRFALKTNLLYDATGTFNLGFEVKLGRKLTLDFPVNYNPWTFSDNMKWKHLSAQPELRYWLCESFYGHFLGVHAHYAWYNVGHFPIGGSAMRDYRYEGWLAGGGVSYGYHKVLSKRWSLEASLGVGYAYLDHDKYLCHRCGDKVKSDFRHYLGVTKAAVSLIYMIK